MRDEADKLTHKIYDVAAEPVGIWNNGYELRGNSFNSYLKSEEKKKKSFPLHAANAWNKLLEDVMHAPSVKS